MSLPHRRIHRNPWFFRGLIACLTAGLGSAGLGGCAHLVQQRGVTSARGDDASSWRMKATQGQWSVGDSDAGGAHQERRADHSQAADHSAEVADQSTSADQPAAHRSRHARNASWDWRWGKRHGHHGAPHPAARHEVAAAEPAHAAAPEPEPEPEPSMGDDDITDLVAADHEAGAAPAASGTMTMTAMQFDSPAPASEPEAAPVKIHHHSKRWCRHHRRRCRVERRRERLAARALRRKQRHQRSEALAVADSPVPAAARQSPRPEPRKVIAEGPRPAPHKAVRGTFDENGEGFLDEADASASPTQHHTAASHARAPAPAPAPAHETVARTSPPPRHHHQFVDDREGFIDDSKGHLPTVKTDHRGQVIDDEDPLK